MSFPEKINILLVDDRPENLLSLEALLDHPEYNLVKAGSGPEALRAILKDEFALILLDVQMPGMDGFETARLIKDREKSRDIPVIFVTAISKETKYVSEGYERGAIDYIFKPYDPHVLKSKVAVLVEFYKNKKRLERQNEELREKDEQLKQTIGELAILNLGLEQRVRERTKEIVAAKDKLERQTQLLFLLNQIVRQIAERLDLPSIFQTVLALIEDQFPVDLTGIFNLASDNRTLTMTAIGPKTNTLASRIGVFTGMILPTEAVGPLDFLQDKALYLPRFSELPYPLFRKAQQAGINSAVAVLLSVEGKSFAILVAGRQEEEAFSSRECEFFAMLGEHLSLAIHHATLYESLERAYAELKETQRAVTQQERLKALGQMASGIAHDINNALSPIVGYAELLLEHSQNLSDREKRYIETIKLSSMDIGKTIARMREFYRQRDELEIAQPIKVDDLLQQVIELTRPRWFDQTQKECQPIECIIDSAQGLPEMTGIENELREALTNLIFNAVDAMPKGGTITLRTYEQKPATSNEERATSNQQPVFGDPKSKIQIPKSHFVIEVTDTGLGMDEETRRKALEPFFTTKGEGGTGLGLAMVFGTMGRHDGHIEIESILGKGTSVRLIFPQKEIVKPAAPKKEGKGRPISPLTILSIDDEPLVRELIKEMLEKDGHKTQSADGGEAGIQAFLEAKATGRPFDLVITDLGMPYVNGREVVRRIKEASPRTPVILLTGWGGRLQADGDIPQEVDAVLSKPPQLKEMRKALSRVMMAEEEKKAGSKQKAGGRRRKKADG